MVKSGADNLLVLGYNFNQAGQLLARTETRLDSSMVEEHFRYDAVNRLDSSWVSGKPVFTTTYASNGNITSTTQAGNYLYNVPSKPFAVGEVTSTSPRLPNDGHTTLSTFTADNLIETMDNGLFRSEFTYSPSRHRFAVEHYTNGVKQGTKMYVGPSEFLLDASGAIVESRTIINAPTGVCAVYRNVVGGGSSLSYVHTDHLGSWLMLSDSVGTPTHHHSYDAWGRPRNPFTWELLPIDVTDALLSLSNMQPFLDRGYTGHEHMAGFGLINMNGRLYDPYLQRFLSPDPFIQAPGNAQNFNRYSYCLNNPLMYTDPSGYNWSPSEAWYAANWITLGESMDNFITVYFNLAQDGLHGGSCGGGGGGRAYNLVARSERYFDSGTGKEFTKIGNTSYVVNSEWVQTNFWKYIDEPEFNYKGLAIYCVNRLVNNYTPIQGEAGRVYPQGGGDDGLMAAALGFAAVAAVIDGPLPVGDAVGIATIVAVGAYVGAKALIDNINNDRRAARDWEAKQKKDLENELRRIALRHKESLSQSGYESSNIGDPSRIPPIIPPGGMELYITLRLFEFYLNWDKTTKPNKSHPPTNP